MPSDRGKAGQLTQHTCLACKGAPLLKISMLENPAHMSYLGYPLEIQRRPYQKSINVHVKPSCQVLVTCAKTTSSEHIHELLKKNQTWLSENLEKFFKLKRKFPPKEYKQGEKFLILGHNFSLQFAGIEEKKPWVSFYDKKLYVCVPKSAWYGWFLSHPHPEYRQLILDYYEMIGKEHLTSRVKTLSEQMDLKPNKLSFRSQNTRWGSCSSKGNITLNWKLVAYQPEIIDYVIVHELAHLKHQNHSKEFWSFVKIFCEHHKFFRRYLTDNMYEVDFLSRQSELHVESR